MPRKAAPAPQAVAPKPKISVTANDNFHRFPWEQPAAAESTPDQPEAEQETAESAVAETETVEASAPVETPQAEASEESAPDSETEQPETNPADQQKGVMLEADYRRKTQELSSERRAFEAERAKITEERRSEREQYGQRLQALEAALKEALPEEPDWDKLQKENPTEFASKWAEFSRRATQLARVRAEREAVEQEQTTEQERLFEEYRADQARQLFTVVPEMQKPEVQQSFMKYAESIGYTAKDLDKVVDHRAFVMLYKAQQWDALQESKKSVVAKPAKVLKPGAKSVSTSQTDLDKMIEKARARANATGHMNDIAEYTRLKRERALAG